MDSIIHCFSFIIIIIIVSFSLEDNTGKGIEHMNASVVPILMVCKSFSSSKL